MDRFRESHSVGDAIRVDRQRHVITDVKLAGFVSGNGRRYTKEAFAAAIPLYESAVANLDHTTDGETKVGRRFGRIKNVRLADDGLRGDLHYNPEHRDAAAILWFAENDPTAIGLSHDVYVNKKRIDADGTVIVEAIQRVASVDIVADPATTGGLYEELNVDEPITPPTGDVAPMDSAEHLGLFIMAIVKDPNLDMSAKRKKLLAALKLMDDAPADTGPEFTDDDTDTAMESLRKLPYRAARWAARRIDADRVRESQTKRREALRQKCLAALPPETVTPVFLETLVVAPDEQVSRLIEDRRALTRTGPRTSVPTPAAPQTVEDLMSQLWGAK